MLCGEGGDLVIRRVLAAVTGLLFVYATAPLSPSLNASAASGTQPAPPQSYRVTMPPTLVRPKNLHSVY